MEEEINKYFEEKLNPLNKDYEELTAEMEKSNNKYNNIGDNTTQTKETQEYNNDKDKLEKEINKYKQQQEEVNGWMENKEKAQNTLDGLPKRRAELLKAKEQCEEAIKSENGKLVDDKDGKLTESNETKEYKNDLNSINSELEKIDEIEYSSKNTIKRMEKNITDFMNEHSIKIGHEESDKNEKEQDTNTTNTEKEPSTEAQKDERNGEEDKKIILPGTENAGKTGPIILPGKENVGKTGTIILPGGKKIEVKPNQQVQENAKPEVKKVEPSQPAPASNKPEAKKVETSQPAPQQRNNNQQETAQQRKSVNIQRQSGVTYINDDMFLDENDENPFNDINPFKVISSKDTETLDKIKYLKENADSAILVALIEKYNREEKNSIKSQLISENSKSERDISSNSDKVNRNIRYYDLVDNINHYYELVKNPKNKANKDFTVTYDLKMNLNKLVHRDPKEFSELKEQAYKARNYADVKAGPITRIQWAIKDFKNKFSTKYLASKLETGELKENNREDRNKEFVESLKSRMYYQKTNTTPDKSVNKEEQSKDNNEER